MARQYHEVSNGTQRRRRRCASAMLLAKIWGVEIVSMLRFFFCLQSTRHDLLSFCHRIKLRANPYHFTNDQRNQSMDIEVIETPIRFHLHGIGSTVQNNAFGEVGLRLMNKMWQVIKETDTATSGINHWVYLPDGNMFVGVELLDNSRAPQQLEPLEFELPRYLKHVHVGPYQALPEKWQALKRKFASCGEIAGSSGLEIYGHHCEDPTKLETTILIGLLPTND